MSLIMDLKTCVIIPMAADRDPLNLQPMKIMPHVSKFIIRSTFGSIKFFTIQVFEETSP